MSKERDALKKAIGIINFTHPNTWHEFISEVQELLAQPEQRLTPLTSKLISLGNNCHESFIKGVRFAEKMHGIGGGNEN
jgi:hypothetical protein